MVAFQNLIVVDSCGRVDSTELKTQKSKNSAVLGLGRHAIPV